MTLADRIALLITAIGGDVKAIDVRLDALEAGGGGGGLSQPQVLQRTLGA
jgi:hypothetical protein